MSTEAWKHENTLRFNVRFTESSGIPAALRKLEQETGESATVYIRQVIREALIRDGYLSENSMPEK